MKRTSKAEEVLEENRKEKSVSRAIGRKALLFFGALFILLAVLLWRIAGQGRAGEPVSVPQEAVLAGTAGEGAYFLLSTLEAEAAQVQIDSCEVLPDGENFALSGTVRTLPVSDDGRFYLFALEGYEEAIPDGAEPIAQTEAASDFTLTAAVNEFQADSRLYDKFVVAVKKNGRYLAISTSRYITNPEALADYTEAFPETDSIKGLLVDSQKLGTTELDELGVKHAVYNVPLSRLLGPTTDQNYPTIIYTYNGKEYELNGRVVSEYDYAFSTLTAKGIVTTAILLNDKSDDYPQMIHPLSRDGDAYYYAFNASDEEGSEYLAAVVSFLAERYRDTEHGIVMNWIVGNEINVRSLWNYMQYVDLKTYVREYVRAFRICYNVIKSRNANARVYISLDQQWNRELTSESSYNSRDILDEFNAQITEEGNIGWGLAHHPYSIPMTWPKFWDMSGQDERLVKNSEDTAVVTIYNISVVTDYLQKKEFLDPEGEVRHFLLSEMGFTSAYGEDVQAAAFAYAYYIAENDPYIDALILSRETDAAEEVSQGLALGLSYQNGRKKMIYDVFKYIDTDQGEKYTQFALDCIGISDWSEVIGRQKD
ncbi:MAG TPA: hypothetical protein H9717_12680 [Candidatus Eisenbergiella merdipullorum]|uniref:DUF5722 domain-containing protein n=1 Tax=Candidatus Eisenbergiella merdipullorum TaxID=2838553 RepID=A0A9D2KZT9_9FIRM|nr:hypothetical protein [Candidatus Eisenbergiella merdipullorum]